MSMDLRTELANLAGMSARCAGGARAIRQQAAARMKVVGERLNTLRPDVLTSELAEHEYLGLVEEQGRLRRVLQS